MRCKPVKNLGRMTETCLCEPCPEKPARTVETHSSASAPQPCGGASELVSHHVSDHIMYHLKTLQHLLPTKTPLAALDQSLPSSANHLFPLISLQVLSTAALFPSPPSPSASFISLQTTLHYLKNCYCFPPYNVSPMSAGI